MQRLIEETNSAQLVLASLTQKSVMGLRLMFQFEQLNMFHKDRRNSKVGCLDK